MYSYWLKSKTECHQNRWRSIKNCPINSGELIGQVLIEGSPLARTGLLGKARKVCVCVCDCFESIECHDALHVGNFPVSCIPIGSSPRQNATRWRSFQNCLSNTAVTGKHTRSPSGQALNTLNPKNHVPRLRSSLRRRRLLGEGSESVCVCVSALSVNDALHVGNFLVSCIPIGSSPRQNATKIGGVQSRIAQSILAN